MARKGVVKTTLVCIVLILVIVLSLMIYAGMFDRAFGVREIEAAGNVAWRRPIPQLRWHVVRRNNATSANQLVAPGNGLTTT